MPGPRKTTRKQDLEIRRLVMQGFTSPTWVLGYLEEEGILEPGHEIDDKIIRRRIKTYLPRDESGPWSAIDDVSGDARGVLRVAQWLFRVTEGRVWLSRDLARLVGRISASADLPPSWAWAFARAHQEAKARKEVDSRCLDLALIACLWEMPPAETLDDPLAFRPKHHAVATACQKMSGVVGGRQFLDLMFGQAALEERLSGLIFDLPDYADDEAEDPETEAPSTT